MVNNEVLASGFFYMYRGGEYIKTDLAKYFADEDLILHALAAGIGGTVINSGGGCMVVSVEADNTEYTFGFADGNLGWDIATLPDGEYSAFGGDETVGVTDTERAIEVAKSVIAGIGIDF